MVGDGIRAAVHRHRHRRAGHADGSSPRPPPTTSATSRRRSTRWCPRPRSSSTRSRPATSPRPRRSSRRPARWERIEPVAESFGDLDPKIDGREDDERDRPQFTGFHRLEKDLWVAGLQADSPADRRPADRRHQGPSSRSPRRSSFTPLELANGAKELLDEVATGKITGEEDRYSHTDLWDFKANVEGSQAAVAALRPVIDDERQAARPRRSTRGSRRSTSLLDQHQVGDGYKLYTELTGRRRQEMTDLDALAEPVSQVPGVVTS